jgi:hypothetical protein
MRVAALTFPDERWSLPSAGAAASLLLHAALLALLIIGQLAPTVDVPPVRSIDVDLLSMAQFATLLAPPPAQAPALPAPHALSGALAAAPVEAPAAAPAEQPAPKPATPSNGPFRATAYYAAGVLADPANAEVRAGMHKLAGSERISQLCNIEAVEQIRRARPEYDPDTVVPYAMAGTGLQRGMFLAPGGAFRSRRVWYAISFRCQPAADLEHVEAFEFTLGDAIPHELWEEHNLTAEDSDE